MTEENKELIEPEIIDETGTEIEHAPAGKPPVKMDTKELAEWIDSKIAARNTVVCGTIRASKASHWINQGDTPFPMEPVASILLSIIGQYTAGYSPPRITRSEWTEHKDEKGDITKIIEKECVIDYGAFGVGVNTGQCSTRDLLLCKTKDGWKPLSEINLGVISSKATTRAIARNVFHHFGMMGLTWEKVSKINPKITPKSVASVKYQGGGGNGNSNEDRSPANKAKMAIMERMVNAMWPGNATAIKSYLIGITENKEKEWAGKDKIAKFSEKQVAYHYNKSIPPKFFEWCETPEGVDSIPWVAEMDKIAKMEGSK